MSKLIELVEEYGDFMVGYAFGGKLSDGDPVLAKIRDAVAELEKDAARFRYLQNIDKKEAQAFFWHFESRKQRAKAIDAAMEQK